MFKLTTEMIPNINFKLFIIIFVVCFHINNVSTISSCMNNERKIEEKIIVITGGAGGIGSAIADNFLENCAKATIILDINKTRGQEVEKTLNSKYGSNRAEFIECDVTKDLDKVSEQIKNKYGFTDVLVNCAGIFDEKNPRKVVLTNVVGTIEFSLKFNELMRKDKCGGKGGTIINIASIVAHYIDPFIYSYRSTKYAISGFSQSLGQEYNYKKTGVRVLTICPGPTNTPLGIKVNAVVSKEILAALYKKYKHSIQAPDNVGKGVVEVFKNAESGTSWDIVDGKPPFVSTQTITTVKIDL